LLITCWALAAAEDEADAVDEHNCCLFAESEAVADKRRCWTLLERKMKLLIHASAG
jgi:hypothetical protein